MMIGNIYAAKCAAQQQQRQMERNREQCEKYMREAERERIAKMPRYDGKSNIPVVKKAV